MHALALALAALGVSADPIDVSPDIAEIRSREFEMPLLLNSPADSVKKVRLFVSTDRGKTWKPAGEYAASAAEVHFKAPEDGLYYFAVQIVHKDGKASPPAEADLTVLRKVRVASTASAARVSRKPVDLAAPRPESGMRYTYYEINGLSVRINASWFSPETERCREILQRLRRQVEQVASVYPPKAAQRLSDVDIWVEWEMTDLFAGPEGDKPQGAMYMPRSYRSHADARLASKSGDVVVYANVCLDGDSGAYCAHHGWLVHEFAHAYQERVTDFDAAIAAAHQAAVDSKSYEKVPIRYPLPGGKNGFLTQNGKAYAITNSREYFAELTVAHLARSMVFPFTRSDLKKHDPRGHELMLKVWGDNAERRNEIVQGVSKSLAGRLGPAR